MIVGCWMNPSLCDKPNNRTLGTMAASKEVVTVFEMAECKMTAVGLFRDGDCRLINSKPQCRRPFGTQCECKA